MTFLRNNILLYFSLLLLVLSSCKKEELPPPGEGLTVFGVKGNIGGQAVDIEAGKNEYYMYTRFEYDAQDSVYTYIGELTQTNCNGCQNSLTISFRDIEKRQNVASVNISDIIKQGSYEYRGDSNVSTVPADSFDLRVVANVKGIGPFNNTWQYGSQTVNDNDSAKFAVPLTDTAATVCLTVDDIGAGVVFQQCNKIRINNTNQSIDCLADFNYSVVSPDSVVFYPTYPGSPNRWIWGDGTANGFSTGTNSISHVYSDTNKLYSVTLRTQDGAGCYQDITKTIKLETSSNDTPNANFRFIPQLRPDVVVTDSLDLNKITIQWVDGAGTQYTSRHKDLPTTNSFEITSVEFYERNENGQPTILFNARITCQLYNGLSTITMSNVVVRFAVAYPG